MSQAGSLHGFGAGAENDVLDRARLALAHERAGRYREAWSQWEKLRRANPGRAVWNAPLAASYLRYAFDWTSDAGEGSLGEAEAALLRGVSILTIDLADNTDDIARLMLIARACEQRCLLRAYGEGWTRAAREALDAGAPPEVVGDPRQVLAAGVAAATALDLVAISAPSLSSLSAELAQSCLRLSATLRSAGANEEADGLELRAEVVLRGPEPGPEERRAALVAIEGGAGEKIRRKLLDTCDVHTLLRLPTGIFYAQGVKANVLFFDNKPKDGKVKTKGVWIYDLRTNKHFTLKTRPLRDEDLRDFIDAYRPGNRHRRKESERFRYFDYDTLVARDKASLDIFWLKDDSLDDLDNLPAPDVLAQEIVEHLEAALAAFRDVAASLPARGGEKG